MIVLNGKYNFAQVFLPKEKIEEPDRYVYLDSATRDQIISFLNHPAFRGRKIRIMPDTHFGKGSCVGFTMDLGEQIIPNIIGVDIGCGIMATKLPIKKFDRGELSNLDQFIRINIPSGFAIRNGAPEVPVDYYYDFGYEADLLGIDRERVYKSIGTLGGGNHFIELGEDEEGFLWLTVHSGSRNFGLKVATFYQEKADELCWKYFQDFGDLNFLPADSQEAKDYVFAMRIAQRYASYNREVMTRTIVQEFFGVESIEQIDSVHNYINFEDGIVRKGATSAREGERLVIPFNMQDGLIIGTGKGNPDWNQSAPHGAGRILSRSAAKKALDLKEAEDGMKSAGVFTTSLSSDTLDEAKGAYKDKDLILSMIKDTVTVNTFVKPIYNFKAK